MKDSTKKTASKAEELDTTITAEQQKVAATLSTIQTQFIESQNQRSSEFTSTLNDLTSKLSTELDKERTELSKLKNDQQTQLNNLFSSHNIELSEHKIQIEKELTGLKEKYSDNLKKLEEDYVEANEKIIEQVTIQQKRVESLVGVIGNLGVSSGFLTVANHARRMVYIWQTFTVMSLIGLIVVSYFVAFPSKENSHFPVSISAAIPQSITKGSKLLPEEGIKMKTNNQAELKLNKEFSFLHDFLSKLFLSITFGIFAAYAAKQGRRFLDIEQKNRQKALELEALGPFIEPLDKTDRDKFRVQVGDRSFGVIDNISIDHKDVDPTNLLTVLKQNDVVESMTKIIKALKS